MNFFPTSTRTILERATIGALPAPDDGVTPPRRWPVPGRPDEIVWSEAAGQLIDIAADGWDDESNPGSPAGELTASGWAIPFVSVAGFPPISNRPRPVMGSGRDLPAGAGPTPPGTPAPDALAPAREASSPPTTVTGHILVVEDDPDIRDILAESLRSAGWRVTSAADGEAGWAALCANRPDVLITDHEMPRLTGLDLIRRVRAGTDNVPVILISGEMPWHETDLLELLAPGAAVEKPFSLAELLAKVRSIWTSTTNEGANRDGPTLLPFDGRPQRWIERRA